MNVEYRSKRKTQGPKDYTELLFVPMLRVGMYGRSAAGHLRQSVKPTVPTRSIGTSKKREYEP